MRKRKTLRPVWPNNGIEQDYKRRIRELLDEMQASLEYWLAAAYKANEPELVELASDEMPAIALRNAMRKIARRWTKRFNEMANRLARWFAQSTAQRSDAALKKILKDAGWSIDFKLTRPQRDVLQAIVAENVGLIRSIPQQYLQQVEGLVMRSVQRGGDLKTLTAEIRKQYGVTRKRAAFISRDQNSKATASLTRVRRLELGLKKAIWMHSSAGKEPRPEHVKMNNKKFDIAKGMWDPYEQKWIQPGELINCRCTSRPVVPGLG